jgi:myo-inositol-hexaphosphate 3-phosphohydrolase
MEYSHPLGFDVKMLNIYYLKKFCFYLMVLAVGLRTSIMLIAFSREGNNLGVGVLLIPRKWLFVPSEGVCVSRFVI